MHNFVICDSREEAYKQGSCYEKLYFTITKEEIKALLAGKILVGDAAGEYSALIEMEV